METPMTLDLYNFPASTCSLKVRICLAEKDLKWVDHSFKPHENKHLTSEYLALNPNGVVPTLVHDYRSNHQFSRLFSLFRLLVFLSICQSQMLFLLL